MRIVPGSAPLPFFAEYPYLLWGETNYDSDGDCRKPTDRGWTQLDLTDRITRETLTITRDEAGQMTISGDDPTSVALAAWLTLHRSGAPDLPEVDAARLASGLPLADEVAQMFLDPVLAPFDSHGWWGGWKWTGQRATDFTTGLRVTMYAVQRRQADPALLAWLREWAAEPPQAFHADGVAHALRILDPRS